MADGNEAGRSISWLRLAAESAAVIVSILLAFAIDAWWDHTRELREEREILLGLETEFIDVETRLREAADRYAIIRRDIEWALDSLPNLSDVSLSRADSAVFHMTYDGTIDLGTGFHDALIASGRLELIRDRELRARLGSWPRDAAEIADNEEIMRTYIAGVLVPFMASQGVEVGRGRAQVFAAWRMKLNDDEEAERAFRRLVTNTEFRSLVQYRYAWALGTLNERIRYGDRVTELIAMIREQLE